MKPANWRTFYSYRPSRSLAWKNPPGHDQAMTDAYYRWLADSRGWFTEAVYTAHPVRGQERPTHRVLDIARAAQHVAKTQHPPRPALISAHWAQDDAPTTITRRLRTARQSPLQRLLTAINRVSTRSELSEIQLAVAERWEALPDDTFFKEAAE